MMLDEAEDVKIKNPRTEGNQPVPPPEPQPLPDIDVDAVVTSLNSAIDQLSTVLDTESSDDLVSAMTEVFTKVGQIDVTAPVEISPDTLPEEFAPAPAFQPIDTAKVQDKVQQIQTQLVTVQQVITQGKQSLAALEDLPNTFVPKLVNAVTFLKQYAHRATRTASGGGSAFNTEDLAHVCLSYEYIAAAIGLMMSLIQEITNHLGEMIVYELIAAALGPIAACAAAIASVIERAAHTIGNAFKLTIIGAFMHTKLDEAVGEFTMTADQILKIVSQIPSICQFIMGQVGGEMGELTSVLERISAFTEEAVDTINHALGVMAVEPVPEIPHPVCDWGVLNPYSWVPGDLEPVIKPFIPPIAIGMTTPTPIIQAAAALEFVQDFATNAGYEVPKLEFLEGGSIF